MENEKGNPVKPGILSDKNERREFKAGLGFYVFMIPVIAMLSGIIILNLCDRGEKKNVMALVMFGFADWVIIYSFLSRVPIWPWYKGPTLIVDDAGLKTEKWFMQWDEIEAINTFRVGKGICIGIVKKGQRPWELPSLIEGPLGASMSEVVEYLQARKSGFTES